MIKMMREMRDLEFPPGIKISLSTTTITITITSLVLKYKIQKDTLTKARLVRLILI